MDTDPIGHGTFIAGIIGAIGNNGVGVTGINWKVQMMPLRYQHFSDSSLILSTPGEFERVLAAGLAAGPYALDNGARVANISAGLPKSVLPPDFVVAQRAQLDEALARGVLIVTAAGNDKTDVDAHPVLPGAAPHANIINLAATDKNDKLAHFSNFGLVTVVLGAPGTNIWSTVLLSHPGEPFRAGSYSGTSFAAPQVVGTAALILSVNPNLSFAEVKALILDNVDPLPDLQRKTVTGGRLNIFKAVSATPRPLRASGVRSSASIESLTPGQVEPLLADALSRWQAAGVDTSALAGLDTRIADLGGTTLGPASVHPIWLDANAAGWGWFVDPTPWEDSEFTMPGDQGEQHRMDLLTVLEYEVGHLLGKQHEAQRVMVETPAARQGPGSDADWANLAAALYPDDGSSGAATWLDPANAWGRKR